MFGLHHLRRYIGLPRFFLSSLTPHTVAHVRYDLMTLFGVSCTIRSGGFFRGFLYDINLGATHTTIPSTRGVEIPISLVSSATDSIWRYAVVFKPVTIPTSDLKSEFLCQLSLIAQNLQIPLNHLVHLGYLPCPRHHVSPVLPQSKCSHRVPEAEAPFTTS